MNRITRRAKAPDYAYITFLVLLVIFGFVMLTSASSDLGKSQFGDAHYYLKHQLVNGFSIGIIGFFIGMFVYYRRWENFAIFGLLLTIVALTLVFSSFGVGAKGGERWLNIGAFTFQPAELLKLTFFMYLAAWFSKKQSLRSKTFTGGLLPFLILLGGVTVLLIAQPATTTAVLIFAAALVMYFTAGGKMQFIVGLALVAALLLALLIYISPYRLSRILTFLNPATDELDAGYHINQAKLAIGSGGIWGVGFGQSTTKLHYLPEPIGDSIFAVLAEEFGFVGSMVFITVFLLFVLRGFRIAKRSQDGFGRLLATGFTAIIGLQAFVNIGAISGMLPLTGVPLPFISYGGTSLAVLLTMSGVMVNISRYS